MRGTKFAVISALLLSSTAAYAADDLAPPPSAYDWTGFHLGAGAGLGGVAHNAGAEIYDYETGGLIQVGPVDIFSIGAMIDAGGDGYLGTIEGGYDVQVGNFVLGIQGDYTWSDIDATAGINGDVCYEGYLSPGNGGVADDCDNAYVSDSPSIDYSLSAKSSWSVLGRVGMVANEGALAYALGGFTRTHLEGALTLTSLPTGTVPLVSYDYDRDGWTVGGGIEALISGSTSMKMEYRRTRWDNSDTYPLGPEAGISTWDDATVHTIRGVLSYRFGGGSAEQQAAVDAIPTVDWTGFSVGASGGFSTVRHNAGIELHDYTLGGLIQVGPVDIFSVGGDIDFGGEGLVGRLEAGYDMQLGNRFVAGVLADYTFSNAESQVGLFGDYCLEGYKSGGNSGPGADDCDDGYVTGSGDLTYTLKTGDSWSVGGRAGVLLNPKTLFYGLGAYTRTSMDADLTLGTGAFGSEELLSYSYDRDGWTYGLGMETMLTDNLSTKLEYRNTKWTDEELYGDALQGFTRTEDSNVQSFTAGLTWRIN